MKQTKKIFLFSCLLAILALGQISGCRDVSAAKKGKTAKKITLNRSQLLIAKGKKYTLKIKKTSPKGASKKNVIYKSSNTKVVSVNKKGRLSARKKGTSKITVKIRGSKAKAVCRVQVVPKLKQISLKKPNLTINKGDKIDLKTIARSSYKMTYESDDKKVVKISSKGILQAVGDGVAYVLIQIKNSTKEPVQLPVKVIRDQYDTPIDYADYNPKIAHGETTEVSYYSSVTGSNRKCLVYTPPGYSKSKKYNVLYCMHGLNGDHKEWCGQNAKEILDNLYARKKLADMIVVFPNGRAAKDDSIPRDSVYSEWVDVFNNFENDLKQCLMPFIEKTYNVYTGRDHTALSGLSMGGMQTINIGFNNPELFNYLGIFSPSPDSNPELIGDDKSLYPKVLWLSCGDSDDLIWGMDAYTDEVLTQKGAPHIYYLMPGGHDWSVWRNGFYNFIQLIFK